MPDFCPQCGGGSWVGDNYGMSCTKCGYNYGYGEWARQSWCNHVIAGGCCIYCEEQVDES